MTYKNSGEKESYIRKTTKTYNKDGRRIVIENVPVISYRNGGDDMLSADTLDRLHEWRTFLRSIPANEGDEQSVDFADYEARNPDVRLLSEDRELVGLADRLFRANIDLFSEKLDSIQYTRAMREGFQRSIAYQH